MIPIYEQSSGNGVGHLYNSFSHRFDELCKEHLQSGRARAFAFIFYDFCDRQFRRVLKDRWVFTQLDRISGRDLSIFYLHAGSEEAVERFNNEFLARLDVPDPVLLPCIVFFKLEGDQITDIKAVHLESADLIHGVHELANVLTNYISTVPSKERGDSKYVHWIKTGTKFITLEAFKLWLRATLSGVP